MENKNNIKLSDLLFVLKCSWKFLLTTSIMNIVTNKNMGKIALINKKIFLLLISFFSDKIFSKFVSIQNQMDINKKKYTWFLKIVFINLCIIS